MHIHTLSHLDESRSIQQTSKKSTNPGNQITAIDDLSQGPNLVSDTGATAGSTPQAETTTEGPSADGGSEKVDATPSKTIQSMATPFYSAHDTREALSVDSPSGTFRQEYSSNGNSISMTNTGTNYGNMAARTTAGGNVSMFFDEKNGMTINNEKLRSGNYDSVDISAKGTTYKKDGATQFVPHDEDRTSAKNTTVTSDSSPSDDREAVTSQGDSTKTIRKQQFYICKLQTGATYINCELYSCTGSNFTMQGCELYSCKFDACIINDCELYSSSFGNSTITNCS